MATPTVGMRSYRHKPETRAWALDLADRGWQPRAISRLLTSRGTPVSESTIWRWLNPERAARDAEANRVRAAAKRAEARRLAPDDPYKGLTGLARKMAMMDERLRQAEERIEELQRERGAA